MLVVRCCILSLLCRGVISVSPTQHRHSNAARRLKGKVGDARRDRDPIMRLAAEGM